MFNLYSGVRCCLSNLKLDSNLMRLVYGNLLDWWRFYEIKFKWDLIYFPLNRNNKIKIGLDSFSIKRKSDNIKRNFFPPVQISFYRHSHLICWEYQFMQTARNLYAVGHQFSEVVIGLWTMKNVFLKTVQNSPVHPYQKHLYQSHFKQSCRPLLCNFIK